MVVLSRHSVGAWSTVPRFDVAKANGNPGCWNNLQPEEIRSKKQTFTPHLTHGVPDIEKFKEFLAVRTDSNGKPLLDMFEEPTFEGEGLWRFQFKDWDEQKLPRFSRGPLCDDYRGTPVYEEYRHGLKVEAAYAILSDIKKPSAG